MLVARRDPPLRSEADDYSRRHGHGHAHSSRFMTVLQVVGSLLAIPVGLASAYSIYHTNFTAEARCENLRGNIISMLDKSADASTLRMLVRRDVVTFETSCGAVDPDAVKVFKALLTAKTALPTPAAAPPHEAAREPAHQPVEGVKQVAQPRSAAVATETKPVEATPAHRDAATSDVNWIASVREALVHAPAPHEEAVKMPPQTQSQPVETKVVPPVQPTDVQPAPQPRVVHEAPPISLAAPVAPALPASMPAAAVPTPMPAADHPVPPGSIPDAQPAERPVEKGHSWISEVPILNRVFGK